MGDAWEQRFGTRRCRIVPASITGSLLVVVCLAASAIAGHGGTLDPSFGEAGVVTTGPPGGDIDDIAALPGGRIVAVGGSDRKFALAAYRSDGRLDPTFGGDGIVSTDIGNDDKNPDDNSNLEAYASKVALQPDGKIVVAGIVYGLFDEFALARYLPDGTLDPTFDGDGVVESVFGGGGMAIQDDGRIIVSGGRAPDPTDSPLLARFLPSGELDRSYGRNGRVGLPPPYGSYIELTSVAIQNDDKAVAVGDAYGRNGEQQPYLVRLTPNGVRDRAFGHKGTGVVRAKIGESSFLYAVRVQPDGRIVVAGADRHGKREGRKGFFVARYLSDGAVDRSFGNGDGLVKTQVRPRGDALDLALWNGHIVVAGDVEVGPRKRGSAPHAFAVVRYRHDGSPDPSFGRNGIVVTRIGSDAFPDGVVVQPDGKVVVGGTLFGKTSTSFALARYRR